MTPLSDSEARTVARFEAAEPAPESWGGGLREALIDALAERLNPRTGMSERAVGRLADALLPVVTAWAEQRARERAAEELAMLAFRLVAQDVTDDVVFAELRVTRDRLTADDRTGRR